MPMWVYGMDTTLRYCTPPWTEDAAVDPSVLQCITVMMYGKSPVYRMLLPVYREDPAVLHADVAVHQSVPFRVLTLIYHMPM
jgi:hypothetical protein